MPHAQFQLSCVPLHHCASSFECLLMAGLDFTYGVVLPKHVNQEPRSQVNILETYKNAFENNEDINLIPVPLHAHPHNVP
jgi:hypothetical protein